MARIKRLDAEDSVPATASLRHLFGENVRLARVTAGLSQEDVSVRASVHRTYVGSVERGERNLTLDNIERIAEALDYSASDLLRADFMPRRDKTA